MKMPPSQILEQRSCSLLTTEENLQIFQLIGNRCQTIGTCVIQLFYTQPPAHSQWLKKDTGVLCFVKDNVKKSYFFRLYCLKRACMLWEQELYNDMEYFASTEFLHTFEGDNCMVAFNFASTEEARELKLVVDQKIAIRKRREEKRARNSLNQSQNNRVQISREYPVAKKKDPAERLAKRKRNITKADIGDPLDFRHISHVGFHPIKGFDVDSEDRDLQEFFKRAGVSRNQLEDRDTREFIYDFIFQRGGREAAVQEVKQRPAPPSPVSGPPVPPRRVAPAPPPTPTQTLRPSPKIPQPQTINTVSNPPSSFISAKITRAPPPLTAQTSSIPPPPSGTAPPPPPPPPPPPSGPPVAPPQGAVSEAPPPPAMDMRSALMESIREGTSLKPVEIERKPSTDDTRGNLLSEIRKGFQLKPTTEREVKPLSPAAEPQGGTSLASALARALADRNRACHSEDDSSSSESNDDEWDD